MWKGAESRCLIKVLAIVAHCCHSRLTRRSRSASTRARLAGPVRGMVGSYGGSPARPAPAPPGRFLPADPTGAPAPPPFFGGGPAGRSSASLASRRAFWARIRSSSAVSAARRAATWAARAASSAAIATASVIQERGGELCASLAACVCPARCAPAGEAGVCLQTMRSSRARIRVQCVRGVVCCGSGSGRECETPLWGRSIHSLSGCALSLTLSLAPSLLPLFHTMLRPCSACSRPRTAASAVGSGATGLSPSSSTTPTPHWRLVLSRPPLRPSSSLPSSPRCPRDRTPLTLARAAPQADGSPPLRVVITGGTQGNEDCFREEKHTDPLPFIFFLLFFLTPGSLSFPRHWPRPV